MSARPFTEVPGWRTFEQNESFLEKTEQLARSFRVSYSWADKQGLLAKVTKPHKYQTKTEEYKHAPSTWPPIANPRILGGGLSQTAIRVATVVNDTAKIDYVTLQSNVSSRVWRELSKIFHLIKSITNIFGKRCLSTNKCYPSHTAHTSKQGISSSSQLWL